MYCCTVKINKICVQVDLQRPKRISGIITQGGYYGNELYWVKSFRVAYRNNSGPWTVIKEANDSEKVSYMYIYSGNALSM